MRLLSILLPYTPWGGRISLSGTAAHTGRSTKEKRFALARGYKQ